MEISKRKEGQWFNNANGDTAVQCVMVFNGAIMTNIFNTGYRHTFIGRLKINENNTDRNQGLGIIQKH